MVSFAINDVLVCFPVFTVEETVDEVGDIMDGVEHWWMINVRLLTSHLGLKVRSVTSRLLQLLTIIGVGDSRAETDIDDGKCEVDNITPEIVADIPVDTFVGEDDGGVEGTTADAVAGV